MGSVLTIQGQMVEITLQIPGKLSIFQFCPYFSTCPFLPPPKNVILEISKDRSITLPSLES